MATAGTLEYLIKIDSSSVQGGLNNAESKVKGFGDKLSAWAVAKGKVIGGLIEKAGSATVNFVKDSLNERREFDKSMAQVAATLGKSTKEVKQLSDFARKMGAETAFSATEAAQALNYMALAGYDTDKSMKMLPTVLNLAAAGNMDLARASDMVTDAQSALGLSIEETEKMVDQMAKTSSKTNTSVEQLGDAFLTVGGTAKMLKGGTTELSAVLGVLADNGIKGSEGGTALRNILLSLSAPTDKAAKELKKLGINVFDSQGKMKDMPTILQDINKATANMTQEQRTNFLSEVFNKRDLKSIEALLGTSADRWKELFGEIENASGSADKMAKTQLDNLEGDMTIFKSAFSEARLSIVEKLTPVLRKFTQFGTSAVQRLTNAFNKRGFSGALKTAGHVFGSFVSMLRGSDNIVFKKLGNTLDKVRKGFQLVKLGFTDFPKAVKKAKNSIDDAFKSIGNSIKKAKIKVADMLGIEDSANATWLDISKKAYEKLKEGLKTVAKNTKIAIAEFLGFEDSENAKWSDIATKIKGKIKENVASAKVNIAEFLGVEDSDNASWGDIANKIKEKIKGRIAASKIRIIDFLGLQNSENTSWSDIAKKIVEKIKNGFKNVSGKTKIKLANLLGLTKEDGSVISDPQDTSWEDIGGNIYAKIRSGIGKFMAASKVKLSSLLGFTDANGNVVEAEWSEIGKKIIDGLTKFVSNKGSFLQKLILGDEYKEGESTWLQVGEKISGWVSEAFADGGLLDALLGNSTEKFEAIAEFAGNFISGIAKWMTTNSDKVADIITSIIDAAIKAAPKIVEALKAIMGDSTLQEAFGQLLVAGFNASMELLEGLFETLGDIIGKAIFGEKWAEMKTKANEKVQEVTGSRKKGDEDWNTQAFNIDEKYGMHVKAAQGSTGNETALMATMRHLGFNMGIPSWWKESGQLRNLVDLRKSAADSGNAEMYEAATAGLRAFGDAWDEGMRGDELAATVQQAIESVLASTENASEAQEAFDGVADEAEGTSKELGKTTKAVGLVNTTLYTGAGNLDETLEYMKEIIKKKADEISNISTGGDEPGNAKGLWRVPFDNYKTRLHRDEMVLTASQARDYREGNVGSDGGAVVAAIQGLRNDLNNLKLVVGQKVFGRAVVNYGGNNINNYLGKAESRLAAGYGT